MAHYLVCFTFLQGSKYYEDKFKVYGRLFMTHLLGKPTIRVRGSDNLQKILHGEDDIVSLEVSHKYGLSRAQPNCIQ